MFTLQIPNSFVEVGHTRAVLERNEITDPIALSETSIDALKLSAP